MISLRIFMVALALLAGSAHADWTLDKDQSELTFLSDKNSGIVERHSFQSFDAQLSSSGAFEASIDVSTVETGIHIRNDRMRAMLFNVPNFPKATVTGAIPEFSASTYSDRSTQLAVSLQVSLVGITQEVPARLSVVRDSTGGFSVQTLEPILLKASDFGLQQGVEALRTVAGLQTISTTVPVSFSLYLKPTSL
jgi:polyisoprenoid-binding protein YceI